MLVMKNPEPFDIPIDLFPFSYFVPIEKSDFLSNMATAMDSVVRSTDDQ